MVIFISGHRDITIDEFYKHYELPICSALGEYGDDVSFVVGDYEGCDEQAQKCLYRHIKAMGLKCPVTVYHMYDKPRNNVHKFPTIGGFTSDHDRDMAMTLVSDRDIAFVRYGRLGSGTSQNVLRRHVKDVFAHLSAHTQGIILDNWNDTWNKKSLV